MRIVVVAAHLLSLHFAADGAKRQAEARSPHRQHSRMDTQPSEDDPVANMSEDGSSGMSQL